MTDTMAGQASDTRRTALGTLLIERDHLDQDQLNEALRVAEENGERLGEVIVRFGWASEDDLARTLAEQWELRYCDRSEISFDSAALRRLSREEAVQLEALPIQETPDGTVVAIAEPTDARLHAVRDLLGERVDFVVVAKTAIEAALRSNLLEDEDDDATLDGGGNAGQFGGKQPPRLIQPQPAISGWSTEDDTEQEYSAGAFTVHLDALRATATAAEAQRERDRLEIDRLTAELSVRDEAISALQQTLRDLAESLGHKS